MLKDESIMNEKLKLAIQKRARNAQSNDELISALFETFEAADIKPREVSLEDMKTALVEAVRASRRTDIGPNRMAV
jgi:hypothetical protein